MRFDIFNTITSIILSNSLKLMSLLSTNTEAYPVVYEEHDSVVRCYDMSSDTTELTDSEIAEYDDVDGDADIDNMPDGQYVVLCNQYRLQHFDLRYLGSVKLNALRLVVHQDGTNATLYNQDKQHFDNTEHATVESTWSVNILPFSTPLVNALDNNGGSMNLEEILRIVLSSSAEHSLVAEEPTSSLSPKLRSLSFSYVDGYNGTSTHETMTHISVHRKLWKRRVYYTCVRVEMDIGTSGGSIVYTDLNGNTNYTVTSRTYTPSMVRGIECIINENASGCTMRVDTTTTTTTPQINDEPFNFNRLFYRDSTSSFSFDNLFEDDNNNDKTDSPQSSEPSFSFNDIFSDRNENNGQINPSESPFSFDHMFNSNARNYSSGPFNFGNVLNNIGNILTAANNTLHISAENTTNTTYVHNAAPSHFSAALIFVPVVHVLLSDSVSDIVLRPVKYCVRKMFGVTHMNTHDISETL